MASVIYTRSKYLLEKIIDIVKKSNKKIDERDLEVSIISINNSFSVQIKKLYLEFSSLVDCLAEEEINELKVIYSSEKDLIKVFKSYNIKSINFFIDLIEKKLCSI